MKTVVAFVLGFIEGNSNIGRTYDDNPNCKLSRAYDTGRSLRRLQK